MQNILKSEQFSITNIAETLLNLIPDLVLVKGPESHILWANKAFLEYYGMSNETLHGLIETGEITRRRQQTGAGANVHVTEIPATPAPVPVLLAVR